LVATTSGDRRYSCYRESLSRAPSDSFPGFSRRRDSQGNHRLLFEHAHRKRFPVATVLPAVPSNSFSMVWTIRYGVTCTSAFGSYEKSRRPREKGAKCLPGGKISYAPSCRPSLAAPHRSRWRADGRCMRRFPVIKIFQPLAADLARARAAPPRQTIEAGRKRQPRRES